MKLKVKTLSKKQIIDITEEVQITLPNKNGMCNIFTTHTTCALTTADLDPGTAEDMLEVFDKLLPKIDFRHPHDPAHAPDHILSSLIGASLTVPYKKGKFCLGTWQRIVLVELDGPREREIIVTSTHS